MMEDATTMEPAKVLARNSACHQCRRRKLKCDAVKPVCTNCTKPRVRGVAATAPPEPCTWDEVRDPSSSKRRRTDEDGESSTRLKELEAKLASFEKAFSSHPLSLSNRQLAEPHPNGIPQPLTAQWNTHTERSADWMGVGSGSSVKRNFPTPPTEHYVDIAEFGRSVGTAAPATNGAHSANGKVEDPIFVNELAMTWPDWPRDLPSFEILEHVARVFFEKVPTVPKTIHKITFFTNLSLPPSHRNFPARPLLHAILAITANHISEDALSSPAYFPSGTPQGTWVHPEQDFGPATYTPRNLASATHAGNRGGTSGLSTALARFQLWHRRKAFDTCPEYFDQNKQVLQVVQAQCIICTLDCLNAWWVDVWMEAGACVRAAIPLQLHESPKRSRECLRRFSQMLLQEAASPLEQAERDRTWWLVYITERNLNATTIWASAIPDQEVTVELPVLQSHFDQGYGELQGTQTLLSNDLFTSHPPLHVDSICLQIKAFKLWADVNAWFRNYTRGSHTVAKFVADPSLRMLLSQINAFRLSCPPSLRRPTQAHADSFDIELITAHMVTYGATISLGEPLIDKDSWTHDIARVVLSAIRACLSMLYDITATSFDVTRLPGTCSYVWSACIRALCRFIAAATETSDDVSVAVFQSEIEVFRLALSLYGEKFPLGYRHGKMIDELFLAKTATEISTNLNLACSADTVFDERFRHGKISLVETNSTSNTPASSNALPTPSASAARSTSFSGISTTETSPNGMLATLQAQSATPLLESMLEGNGGMGNTNGNLNGGWSWTDTTPTVGSGGVQTPMENLIKGPGAGGANSVPQGPAPAAMWNLADFNDPSLVDAGFNVSSISFDFDAMAELFANSGATFNGEDFVFPNQY